VKKIQDRQERSWCLLNGVDKENEVLWEEEELARWKVWWKQRSDMMERSDCKQRDGAREVSEEQKLLLTAYRKSYMRNRLVPKSMTLTFVRRSFKLM